MQSDAPRSPSPEESPAEEPWRASSEDAEAQTLDASLAATPSQPLAWLEEALAFAMKVGALPKR